MFFLAARAALYLTLVSQSVSDKKDKTRKNKTKKEKDKKTKDNDQKESLLLLHQGSFALLLSFLHSLTFETALDIS